MPPGEGLVETLYSHPNIKIVSFTASGPNQQSPGRSSGPGPTIADEPGTLSWTSPLERSIAIGPFSIYRAPGSVAFLNCGSALQPILPKSQCWAMDEESTVFVLQIRRPLYWRIELPTATDEDDEMARLLPDVFDKVLQFEKTACPFRRGFTIEVPEAVPIIWRRWMPRPRPEEPTPAKREFRQWPAPAFSSASRTAHRRGSDLAAATADDEAEPPINDSTSANPKRRQPRRSLPLLGEGGGEGPDGACEPLSAVASGELAPDDDSGSATDNSGKMPGILTSRSGTAPPQLSLATSPPSKSINAPWAASGTPPATPPNRSPDGNLAYAVAFPSPHDSLGLLPGTIRRRVPSDVTATPDARKPWDVISTGSSQESQESIITVPDLEVESSPHKPDEGTSTAIQRRPSYIRHRSTLSGVGPRPLASLPPAAALFSSPSPPKQEVVVRRDDSDDTKLRRIPMQIITKAAHVFLGPPAYLVVLMLRVAARIIAGEWRGLVFGVGEHGEEIPVRWDYSDQEPAGWDDGSHHPHYGCRVGGPASRNSELD